MELISVIVPVYNGSHFIADTLRSVASQTHRNVEIIVVDDASTDDSVQTALASGVQFRLLRQPNAGVSSARNAGLAAASGEFICFLDQDDIWHPSHVRRQVDCFYSHPEAGVVVSPYQHWYPHSAGYTPPTQMWLGPMSNEIDPEFSGWVYHQFLLDCWALTSATMIRRGTVLAHGGFDETLPYSEDWDLWLRLSCDVPFTKLRWPPVLYRQHAVQGSRTVRPVDYRCQLLLTYAARHGLASRDGRHIEASVFDRTIARYQMEFGCHQLQYGDAALGIRTLLRSWKRHPTAPRALALAAAGCLGWRPRRSLSTSSDVDS